MPPPAQDPALGRPCLAPPAKALAWRFFCTPRAAGTPLGRARPDRPPPGWRGSALRAGGMTGAMRKKGRLRRPLPKSSYKKWSATFGLPCAALPLGVTQRGTADGGEMKPCRPPAGPARCRPCLPCPSGRWDGEQAQAGSGQGAEKHVLGQGLRCCGAQDERLRRTAGQAAAGATGMAKNSRPHARACSKSAGKRGKMKVAAAARACPLRSGGPATAACLGSITARPSAGPRCGRPMTQKAAKDDKQKRSSSQVPVQV